MVLFYFIGCLRRLGLVVNLKIEVVVVFYLELEFFSKIGWCLYCLFGSRIELFRFCFVVVFIVFFCFFLVCCVGWEISISDLGRFGCGLVFVFLK